MISLLEAVGGKTSPINKVKIVARGLQPLVGQLLRDVITEAYEDGVSWAEIGKAMGMDRAVVWRQFYKMEGPMLSRWSRVRSKKT